LLAVEGCRHAHQRCPEPPFRDFHPRPSRKQAIQLQALRNDIAAGKASGAALAADPVFDRLQAKYEQQAIR
jgi:hypothetical protein